MPETIDIFECDSCGLCCKKLLVEASSIDVLREPRIQEAVPLEHGKNLALSLPVIEATWVLHGEDGCPFLSRENRCGIYPTRPNTCVAFAAGSEKCQDLRFVAGLPPLKPVKREKNTLTELAADHVTAVDEDD